MTQRHHFTVHCILPRGVIKAGSFAVDLRGDGRLDYAEFRYLAEFANHPDAVPLLPMLPLDTETRGFPCQGDGVPGFIEELLPDAWGRLLLAQAVKPQHLDRGSMLIALLSTPPSSVVGRFFSSSPELQPGYLSDGVPLAESAAVIRAAWMAERNVASPEHVELLRMAGASHLKGARPKFLAYDERGCWIAKVERVTDQTLMLEAEETALRIAREAGLSAPDAHVQTVDGTRALFIQRFDRQPNGRPLHVVSANALLKDERSQQDRSHPTYDNLAELIRRHSVQPAADLHQLLGLALLNSALRNTDDHLRNFSFLVDEEGLRLSPAYDIVPTPVLGAYHQLGWGHSPILPSLREGAAAARHLGLPEDEGAELASAILRAIHANVDFLRAARVMPAS